MSSEHSGSVARQFQTIFRDGIVAGMTDAQLLERFAGRRDETAESAFETLVARHGPMVLGVCRNVLGDKTEADDAFQATFLVLVRKARSIWVRDSLGPWLYGVAHRVAVRARANASRRRAKERRDPAMTEHSSANAHAETEAEWIDLGPLIHDEIGRLPEKYRAPIVLCYMQGQSHEQAAQGLKWPIGTVKGRLSRARDLLRARLVRRGLALSGGTLATSLSKQVSAAVPVALASSTVKAAMQVAAGKAAAAGLVSASALLLTEGAVKSMFLAKLKIGATALMVVGLAASTGAYAYQYGGFAASAPGQAGGIAPRPAAIAKGGGEAQAAPSSLAKDRVQLAQEAMKTIQTLVSNGEASPDLLNRWSRRLMESQRAAGGNPQDAVAAAEAHLARMKDAEQRAIAANKVGTNTKLDIQEAQYQRMEAEQWLADVKAGPQPAPAGGGGIEIGGFGGGADPVVEVPIEDGKDPLSKAVLAKLEEPITLKFDTETPLMDVIDSIKKSTIGKDFKKGIPIFIDQKGIDENQKDKNVKVTIDLEGVPLRRCLRILLRQADLNYIVRDGLVMISTYEGLGGLVDSDQPTREITPKPERPAQGGGLQ